MFDRKIIIFNAIYSDKCSMNYAIELLKINNFVDKIKFRREYSKFALKKDEYIKKENEKIRGIKINEI